MLNVESDKAPAENQAFSVAKEFIERSTRFGVSDLRQIAANSQQRQFDVTVTHTIEVVSDEVVHKGRVVPDEQGIMTKDWQLFLQLVSGQVKSELDRGDTFDSLVASVKAANYGEIESRKHIRTHPRALHHSYTCECCHGEGKVGCHSCNSSGHVGCPGCGSSGRVRCSVCHGSARVAETYQVRDYKGYVHNETRYRRCFHCNGGTVICRKCGGSGQVVCSTCSGSGKVTCEPCEGHGCLTLVVTTKTFTVPEYRCSYPEEHPKYVGEAMLRVGLSRIGSVGELQLQKVDEARDRCKASFTYVASVVFSELALDVAGVTTTFILFGSPPQIFDADGICERLLDEDRKQIASLAERRAMFSLAYNWRASVAIRNFVASEVNQTIVDADARALAPGEITESVSRSISPLYVTESLSSLQRIVRAVMNRFRVGWLLFLPIMTVVAVFGIVVYQEHGIPHSILESQKQLILFPAPSLLPPFLGIAFLSVPVASALGACAFWISGFWVRRAGGKRLFAWARKKRLLMDGWSIFTAVAFAVGAAGAVFTAWPIWTDSAGKLYGEVELMERPTVIKAEKTKSGRGRRNDLMGRR